MSQLRDYRGDAVSGATHESLAEFEQALALYQSCRGDPVAPAAAASELAPGFAMGRVLLAHLHLGGRDPAGGTAAMRVLSGYRGKPALERERRHFSAIAALAHEDYDSAHRLYDEILADHPRDALALQVSHSMDYVNGRSHNLRDRVAWVLPAWDRDVPGYHAVLSMHAFGLEECGEYVRAQEEALHALELEPRDLRAHHAITHVLEMLGRAESGVRWMGQRTAYWMEQGSAAAHLWWHLALFHIGAKRPRHALLLYDQRIGPPRAGGVSGLIDASALLWRLELLGVDIGGRWHPLAERWAPHASDGYCAFNDLHAMMAFVGAGRHESARELLATQEARITRGGTNAAMTRLVGLPASRALQAFGRKDFALAAELLARLPPIAHRIGGSLAQRDVLELTRAAASRSSLARAA